MDREDNSIASSRKRPLEAGLHFEEVLSLSREFEVAGGIAASISILLGFRAKNSSTLSAMGLVRLYCRIAALYKLYTLNAHDETRYVQLALQAVQKCRGDAASELTAFLYLWDADLHMERAQLDKAAKSLSSAESAFGTQPRLELTSYVSMKRAQLLLFSGDVSGALNACLAVVSAEKQKTEKGPSGFNPTRTLSRLLCAHLYLRVEDVQAARSCIDLARNELRRVDCCFQSPLSSSSFQTDRFQCHAGLRAYLNTVKNLFRIAVEGSKDFSLIDEDIILPKDLPSPSCSHCDALRAAFCFGEHGAMICLSPPSLQDSVQALLASFQHADKTVQEPYHPQSDRINLTMNHFPVDVKDGDPVRDAINGLVLLRQIDLFLASWQLQNAQSSMMQFIQLVDSDALFNARPERTRNELICSFQCTIARYLWRLPDHAAEAKAFLRQAANDTSSHVTRVGATIYEALMVVLADRDEEDGRKTDPAGKDGERDVEQLLTRLQEANVLQESSVSNMHLPSWHRIGIAALKAVTQLHRADQCSSEEVASAQQTLLNLVTLLEDDCEAEMAVFIVCAHATFADNMEHAIQQICRQHLRTKKAGDVWLERRILRALERCYLASESQERFARASMTIRQKRDAQYRSSVQLLDALTHHKIVSWKPRSSNARQ